MTDQPRISDFWRERADERRLRLARAHRQVQLVNAQRAPGRPPRAPYKHRGDINRPLWFMDDWKGNDVSRTK
jgi:hypothetical protein